jgi:hypothetical protein
MKPTIIILVAAFAFSSCKKQDSNPAGPITTQEKVTDYYPLEKGDYWVYQLYAADTSFVFTPQNTYDSVWVEGDSLLHGTSFKVINTPLGGVTLWRDSADYIVNELGQKLFTIKNTSDYLINENSWLTDTSFYNRSVMMKSDSVCVAPAGQFQAKYVIGTITAKTPYPSWMMKRNYYFAFSKNVGLVLRRMVFSDGPFYMDERLVRYHLNTN